MAENKKSFVLYSDNYGLIKQLPDEIAGKLLKHIFSYVNDENPISEDLLLNIAFEPIKMQLKRDLVKYELIKEKRSLAGKKSAELRQQTATNPTSVDFVQQTATKSTVSDSVNDNDNVSVSDNVNDIKDIIPEIKNFGNDDIDFNGSHAQILKFESFSWIESVAMQEKIPIEEIQTKIDDFVLFLKTTTTQHKNKKAFITHFVNWLPKQKNKKNNDTESNNFVGKQQFRFSTDNAIKTITGDS